MTQVLGDMASGEMTPGRLDRLPAWIHREGTPLTPRLKLMSVRPCN